MKRFFLLLLLLGLIAMTLSTYESATNCGGNSAALSYTGNIGRACSEKLLGVGHKQVVDFEAVLEMVDAPYFLRFGWGVDSYWILKKIQMGEKQPVAVCAQEFGNVPKPSIKNFYRRNPGHAASYLDGSVRILSRSEFKELKLSDYALITESALPTDM